MFFHELIKLTRFEHAIMLAFAVLIAQTAVLGAVPGISIVLVLSLLVPVLSEMGSFALNDYLDMETDRLNKKTDRPLVKGTISPEFALYFSIASLALSVALAFLINFPAFAIALAFNVLAVMYNWKLKDLPLVGNAYIALTMAIPFIFGNFVVAPALAQITLILALLGFVAGLAREIIKSAQDMEGDRKARGSRTLPIIIGEKKAVWAAVALYILFIGLSVLPFIQGLPAAAIPISLVAAADAIILIICYKSQRGEYRFARNASLVAFMLGMVGIMAATLG
ncbi:MAG: UbiA family prenyltransferase [Candidatus Micrarchaeota archaeon]